MPKIKDFTEDFSNFDDLFQEENIPKLEDFSDNLGELEDIKWPEWPKIPEIKIK